jgi:hypothetical protein
MKPPSHRFQAPIYKIWMLSYVDVPEEVGRALEKELASGGSGERQGKTAGARKSAKAKYIPVVAIAGGRSARTTLVPAGGGRYRLQFNATLRKAARADVGDLVGVKVRVDRESRALPVPEEIREALQTRPEARKAFEAMGPGTRRQLVLWFGKPRSAAARQKRLARLLDILTERALLGRKKLPGRRRRG